MMEDWHLTDGTGTCWDCRVEDHEDDTDHLTLDLLVERVQDWGGCWVEDVFFSPGHPDNYWTMKVVWSPDLGEYCFMLLEGHSPHDLWLEFIQKAPL